MKSIIFALISILCLAETAAAQQQQQTDSAPPTQGWVRLNTGSAAGLNAVDAHGDDTVYASGGALLRSIDGGTTWQTMATTPVSMGQLLFVDDTTGFLVSGESVYKTIDGGQTWSDTSVGFTGPFLFQGPDTGWISGKYIIRTTDRGKTWYQENGAGSNCIAFAPDGKHGYVMGNAKHWTWRPLGSAEVSFTAAYFERTTDGGVNWEDLYYDSLYLPQRSSTEGYTFVPNDVYGVAVTSPETIFVVGASLIAKSTDGGDNWDTASVPHYDYNAISFPDSTHGTAVGTDGIVMHTSDAGTTWIRQNSGLTTEELNSVSFVDSLHGFAAGSQGVIIATMNGGQSWVRISLLTNQIQGETYPNPSDKTANIRYTLTTPQKVNISLQNLTGVVVQTPLSESFQSQGDQVVAIDTSSLASGTYTYVLRTEKYFATGKIEVVH